MKLKRLRHKYNAVACHSDDIRFPSKLERDCYLYLKSLRKEGKILFFMRQAKFDLPGGSWHNVDFQVFTPSEVLFIESKGKDMPVGRLKREMCCDLFNIDIKVVHSTKELVQLMSTLDLRPCTESPCPSDPSNAPDEQ